MYLTDYIESNKYDSSIPRFIMDGTTYKAYYLYWREELFNRVINLFVWNNTGEVKPKEIELRLILSGRVALCDIPRSFNVGYKETLTAMWCTMFGVTKYEDEFLKVNVRCPLWTGEKTIGKDVVIISNNSLRNPLAHILDHYAQMLAHNEVSIISALINVRDAGGVPTVSTEKQKQSMINYYKNLYNGKFATVTDIANLSVSFVGSDRKTQQNVKDLFETRSALIKAFYAEIGIRTAFEKNNNAVNMEVVSDTSQLKFNINDMLECRKRGVEEVNEMFGTNWTVEINNEINYIDVTGGAGDGNTIKSE